MEYKYSKKHLKQFLIDNIDQLLQDPKFQALIVEVKVAEDAGSDFINAVGYDEVHPQKGRIETKFTNYIMPGGALRISAAGENKRNGFDILRIIDGINERIFEVPHDEYFNRGKRYGNEFKWSSSYNVTDKVQVNNTNLLLEYQIS